MKWVWPEQQDTPLLDWVYKSRNITDKEKFLNPTFENIHDPFLLHDMDKAVEAISKAVKDGKKIIIHGDYDVDGITSTSIMWLFLKNELGADVLPYIPSRFTEGYGFSNESLDNILKLGGEFVISVDCGIKDIKLVNEYSDKLDFVITDHHSAQEFENKKIEGSKKAGKYLISNKALAVVHPMLNKYPFKEICGAGVSWKVCCALNEHLKLGVDMTEYIDLAALGTICDIMPLIDENRSIVKLGLEKIQERKRAGLNELLKITKIEPSNLKSFHVGYILGPRLNASGRLEDAMDGVRLLTTSSTPFARQLAQKLDILNSERRGLTIKYLEEAENLIKTDLNNKFLFIIGEDWPEGILGLIAGKLTQKYRRPVIVGSEKNGKVKASARSIESFHIANALKESSKYLTAFGGHSQAAGLSFERENFEKLYKTLLQKAEKVITESDMEEIFTIDAIASIGDLSEETINNLSILEPFGEGNKQPTIGIKNIAIKNYIFMGKDKSHIKLIFPNEYGEKIEAVGFGAADKFTKEILETNAIYSTPLDLAGHLELNQWNGNKTVTLKLEDFKVTSI